MPDFKSATPDLPPAPKPAQKPKAVKKVVSTETKLARLGLRTDMDLVLHLPMRYEDETKVYTIRDACLRGGESWQVEGVVTKCEVNFKPRKQLLVTIADETGDLLLRFMNFYGSQVKQLAEGTRVRARAELKHGFFGAEMVHPVYKVVNEGAPLPTALTPVYPSGEGLSQHVLRRSIADAMRRIDWTDTLPDSLLRQMQLAPFQSCVRLLHYPPQQIDESALMDRSHPAWVRMKFDELLAQQLSLKRAQYARRSKGAAALPFVGSLSHAFQAALPFRLTGAQARVLDEVRADLRQPYPMQRLLQGDVGSGKTVVAALSPWLRRVRRWPTPKRCCSSTITRPSFENCTLSWISACVPITSCASPDSIRASAAVFSFFFRLPVSQATFTPSGSIQAAILRKCCSARISVGAINAAW